MTDTTTAEPAAGFAALGLDARLVEPLAARGYTAPTPIQQQAIPPASTGRDLIGLAGTGTGKTAAFALPILHRMANAPDRKQPFALILVPTRELAVQVASAVSRYGKTLGVKVQAVFGGAGFNDQVRGLRGADVVVATPGRALDHLRRGTMNLAGVSVVVLDEADEMLDMGFADDLDAILAAAPTERQTMLFSATMPPRIAAVANKHLKNPVRVTVVAAAAEAGVPPKLREAAYLVFREHKTAALARVLEHEGAVAAIVFCRTRSEADEVADALAARGLKPESLHGGHAQEHRDRVMRKFRTGAVGVLVATDVAARGLDISHLSHVVNYGIPAASEIYVHRVGRVGRAGREGVAITLLEPREQGGLKQAERAVGRRIPLAPLPTAADMAAKRIERLKDTVRELLAGGLPEEAKALTAELATEFGPAETAAAALALALRGSRPADETDIPVPGPRRPERAPNGPANGPATSSTPFVPRRGTKGMGRVFVAAGRLSGVGRRELLDALGNEVGLSPRDIGNIEIAERFCLVEVPAEMVDHVVESLDGFRVRGRRVPVRQDRQNQPVAT